MTDRRAFVAGYPIAQSRSPLIHGHWLRKAGIDGSYERIDVSPQEFPGFLATLAQRGLVGGNVTIPHKEAAHALVSRQDTAASAIGAVNTVWIEEGVLCGANTDAYGFAANLDDRAPEWRQAGSAMVLGAGGAARAIVYALRQAGIPRIAIANRTKERAEALAAGFEAEVVAWSSLEARLCETDLLVNTTSLGMAGKGLLDIRLDALPDGAIVNDIVYVPLETPLLAAARTRGLATVDGLGMLLHQAAPGFERWFGVRPVVDEELRTLVIEDLGASA